MQRIALFFLSCLVAMASIAQNKIIVQGTFPDLYIIHKTGSNETLTNISKMYNLSVTPSVKLSDVKDNGTIGNGKEVKIPVGKNNFTQDGQQGENETLLPLYHVVQKNENLFRISQLYNKVRIDFLREWNDLNSDVVQLDQKVIIGHLKVPKDKARLILTATNTQTAAIDNSSDTKDEKASGTKPAEPTKTDANPTSSNDDNDEGFFVTQYPSASKDKQLQAKSGSAATFKTTSGWSDKKYYVLMNDVTPGTIVRITASNNKSVCAKVLGSLPDMKENSSLLVRMSNAAASALRITDANFQVQVSFFK